MAIKMLNILDQLPGFIAWKDSNYNYLGCNRNLASALGFRHAKEIIGLTDNDIGETSEEALTFYRVNDLLALSGKTVKFIHTIGSLNPSKSFLLEKKPLLNSDNAIVGILYQCQELKKNLIATLQAQDEKLHENKLLTSQYKVETFANPLALSARELECLFCILRSMTAKKIAAVLGLSKRTIEFYIENVKNKFGCLHKTELLLLAIDYGYMNVIPPRFVNIDLQEMFAL